jgi:hypothetical protein
LLSQLFLLSNYFEDLKEFFVVPLQQTVFFYPLHYHYLFEVSQRENEMDGRVVSNKSFTKLRHTRQAFWRNFTNYCTYNMHRYLARRESIANNEEGRNE